MTKLVRGENKVTIHMTDILKYTFLGHVIMQEKQRHARGPKEIPSRCYWNISLTRKSTDRLMHDLIPPSKS